MKISLNKQWTCYSTPWPEEWHLPREERLVDLPHDDNIRFDTAPGNVSGPAGAYYPGCSTEYEKTLAVPSGWLDKKVSILFDGVYHNAVVRVNNQFAARCNYGYTAFQCGISPFLHEGDNRIRVSAANADVPNSRWYTGTGVYRNVELWVQEPVMIPWRGVRLTTAINGRNATLNAAVTVENHTAAAVERSVMVQVNSPGGLAVASALLPVKIDAGGSVKLDAGLDVNDAQLWTDETPNLYEVLVVLLDGARASDEHTFRYGLRTVSVDNESGLLLNGKAIKLRGGCIHHDHGILGSASIAAAELRRVRLLKDAGFNAIRSAHNPASDALLSACDRLGMYVLDEAFDMWREPKMPYDNSMVFEQNWRRDISGMVERDRNHACVIMYSTGNEVPERDGHSDGATISRQLADHIRLLDPTRPVTHCLCSVSPEGVTGLAANKMVDGGRDYFAAATEQVASPLDIVGYNYMPDRFEKDRRSFPDRVFCATETVNGDILNGWDKVERFPWVVGDFVWTAMDYLGEAGLGRAEIDEMPRGLAAYPYRLSGCGVLDIAGRQRAAAFYRKCVWGIKERPYIGVEDPALHDSNVRVSWWGWPVLRESWHYPGQEGKPARVKIYSRADEVALYLNGRLISIEKAGRDAGYTASFETLYIPGTLKAVELTAGSPGGEHSITTPGASRQLQLTADRSALNNDHEDLIFISVQLTDHQGTPVINEERMVRFSVDGCASLLAAGNTAIKTTANYTNPSQQLYEGHAFAALRANGHRGMAVLHCASDGLAEVELKIDVR